MKLNRMKPNLNYLKAFLSALFICFAFFQIFAQETPKKWTLQESVEHAMSHNLSVVQGNYNVALQENEVKSTKDNALPYASASTSLGYNFGAPDINNTFNNSIGVSAGVDIYNGKKYQYAKEIAGKSLEISKLNVEKIQSDLAVRVVSAYLNVLYNREGVIIAQDQVGVGQKLLKRMQELVNAGVNAKNDLYQAQATLATNEESLITAQNNLDVALLDLAQLLQVPFQGFDIADVAIAIDVAKLKYNNSEMIYEKALAWRPEIKSANLEIESTDVQIKNAKAGSLPSVSASYSFGTNYLNVQNIANQTDYFKQLLDNRSHGINISASVPLFDKFVTKNNTSRVRIQKMMAENNLETEKTNLRSDIERAYLDAKTSLKTYEAAQKTVEAQQEAFRTAEERFNLGVLTSYDFEQVRNQLVLAQSSFIRAKYNFIFKSKFLEIYYGLPVTL